MPATPAVPPAKGRVPPQTAPAARTTRSRAAKDVSTPMGSGKPAGLLARGKEGLRKVSDKIKDKEKDKTAGPSKGAVGPALTDSQPMESLKAFLRIRPPPEAGGEVRQRPYLELQNDKEVLMRAPADITRAHIPKAPLIFSFDRVFPPSSPQSSFFSQTTLPLVEKLLHGENGLLFAYGVTNSGKSYTISGGQGAGIEEKGVLPRAVDVVFNSIQGMESKSKLRCAGTGDVIFTDQPDIPIHAFNFPVTTSEQIKVDKNYSYAIFVSYAEVYNDKIFDLLDSVLPSALAQSQRWPSHDPRASFQPNSSMSLMTVANGGGGVLKRRVLQLNPDPDGNGKYISGLNEVRVKTREEALSIFSSGQSARQVFSTLSNRESSRSHGIFTIKVVRIHNGAPNDPDSAQVSRLAIVDLAGSERNKNTGTTGDRLKEAGNINKSLMVLGQCLETLRSNQQKIAAGGKKVAMVPFRHAKLTEIFQNFFVGDGRAVMIVNVNPYDTGFDENSHVMRFSAVAREVQTTAANKVTFPGLKRQISTQFSAFKQAVSGGPAKVKVVVPVLPPHMSKDMAGGRESEGYVLVEEELEVVEEANDEEEDEEDGTDVLVDSLFDQLREMKTRLYEAEMRNATLAAEIREQCAVESHALMTRIQAEHRKQMLELTDANDERVDRKIDLVARMTPGRPSRFGRDDTPMSSIASDGDTTMDEEDDSFASALDTSHIRTSGRMSDPFIVKSPGAGVPGVKITRSSEIRDYGREGRDSRAEVDDELALDSEGETETELDVSQDLHAELADQRSPVQTALPGRPASSALISPDPIRARRAETAESDDVLATPFDATAANAAILMSEDELSGDDDSDEDEGEEEEESDEDIQAEEEELDTGDQADQDSSFASSLDIHPNAADTESDSESSFEASGDSSSEEEEVPIRRASRARRTTGSPRKRSPVKRAACAAPTPVGAGKKANSGAGTPGAMALHAATPHKGSTRGGNTKKKTGEGAGSKGSTDGADAASSPLTSPRARSSVLGERLGQDTQDSELAGDEEEDEDEVVVTKPKKKRTLGKKVIMEDDMDDASAATGAEVRRMVRG